MNTDTLYDDDTASGNDSGFAPILDVGTHNYEITEGHAVNFQEAPLGVAFSFKRLADGKMRQNMYAVFGSHEVARRIAREKLKALGDACGLSGKMTLDRLENFVGKKVEITVTEHKAVGEKIFAQISTTYPASGKPASSPAVPSPVDDDPIPMEHPTDPPAAPAPEAAASSSAPKKSWRDRRAATPA